MVRSRHHWRLRALGAVVIAVAILGMTALHALAPVDRLLSDWRFNQSSQPASQDIVFLDIDGATLDSVGIWPWPRSIHAQIIDRLLAWNVHDVWVDIDFSSASTAEQDAILAASLQSAGGYAYLAAFERANDLRPAMPIPSFRQYADMFSVNVLTDASGVVRAVPMYLRAGQTVVPSLALALSGVLPHHPLQSIDYGIDAATIPTVSAGALLDGTADPALIADRHVVIGTSALELKDTFFTPNQGPLPGAVVQILAAETLLAGRSLVMVSTWWIAAATLLLLTLQLALPIAKIQLRIATLGISAVAVELVALILYLESAIVLPTGVYHAGTAALIAGTLILDTRILSLLVQSIGGERDAFRAMLEQVIADNYDGVLIADSEGKVVSASHFAAELLGGNPVGQTLDSLLPAQLVAATHFDFVDNSSVTGETGLDTALGWRELEFVVTNSHYGKPSQTIVVVTFRDITARKSNEARLLYLADHDPVTDTFSRTGFIKHLENRDHSDSKYGIFVLQLERFGTISASLGHEAGELLLRIFGNRLLLSGFSAVAHLGQARFAIAADGNDPAERQFEKISELTRLPFNLDGHTAKVGLSAGYAQAGQNEKPISLLRCAEAALVSIDARNLGRLAVYDGTQTDRISKNRTLEGQLAKALEDNQFFLQFQPQVNLITGLSTGAEALLRWRREDSVVPPCDFLPIAEETGMIIEITRWVLAEACRTALQWDSSMRVAVNISALHFELGDLVADVLAALEATGLPAERLELEITETAAMTTRHNAIAALQKFRSMGISIAIDDFGTGQSSLAYLDELPFDLLKIDKAFVDRLAEPCAPHGIISGIIGIAQTMNKRVLAEGIEHPFQAELLRNLGCEFGQGYYWSKPIDGGLIMPRAA